MTDRELFEITLDALEEINKLSVGENAICLPAEIDTAMDALRERLAQPEQEREKVAHWMVERGYATGHGDTVEDLLKELEWQVAEREREAMNNKGTCPEKLQSTCNT
jgi:hypothetical protein